MYRYDIGRTLCLMCTFCIFFVSAAPPLDIALRNDKETEVKEGSTSNKYTKESLQKTMLNYKNSAQIINENIDTRSDSESLGQTHNTEMQSVSMDNFVPLFLPSDFHQYDEDGDGYIDLQELTFVTGATENAKQALGAADIDNDGKVSEKEFHTAPWMLSEAMDKNDEKVSEKEFYTVPSMMTKADDNHEIIDEETNDDEYNLGLNDVNLDSTFYEADDYDEEEDTDSNRYSDNYS